MDRYKYIVRDPRTCHGKPVFKGTRILVHDIVEMLAEGMTEDEILEEYPQLDTEMIREAKRLLHTNMKQHLLEQQKQNKK